MSADSLKKVADMPNPLESPEAQPMLQVLRKVVFRRDPKAREVTVQDLREAMRYMTLTPVRAAKRLLLAFDLTLPDPAGPEEIERLLDLDNDVQPRLRLPEDIAKHLSSMLSAYGCFMKPAQEKLSSRSRMSILYRKLKAAAVTVPGQLTAADDAAFALAVQLADGERHRPISLLLHGPDGSGTDEMAMKLAESLEKTGYPVLEIDCSQYRSEGEAASWDGSKSYWAGSKPGMVTSFVYRHRQCVVIFRGIDRTLPRVMESLRGALRTGVMVDGYGLEEAEIGQGRSDRKDERPPTPVDCRDAVFLFTAATGSEWFSHPELAGMLGDEGLLRKTMIEAMRSSQQEYRGEQIPVFDMPVLRMLQEHATFLRPQNFQTLRQEAEIGLDAALENFTARFSYPVQVPFPDALIDIHLLSCAVTQGLAATQPRAFEMRLLAPLERWLVTRKDDLLRTTQVVLSVESNAKEAIEAIAEKLGDDPLSVLSRKRQYVHFDTKLGVLDGRLMLSMGNIEVRRIFTLSDYTGEVIRLNARIPETRFPDVDGHEECKTFFREMIGYLKHPDALQTMDIDLPRGALLYGPPGTGKTLLAQAFAGEADLPFVSTSAADLLHPERIGELYRIAHANAPCVVFIDECDTLGERGKSGIVHDAALNKLLVEIQGFSRRAPIFHILATNRESELDEALTRAGRIDRHFRIGPLDRAARLVQADRLLDMFKLDRSWRERLAALTYGMTGAEFAVLRRECGLRALRAPDKACDRVSVEQLFDELAVIKYGRRNLGTRPTTQLMKRIALHESGHALLHQLNFAEIPIDLVSISPLERGEGGLMAVNGEASEQHDTTASGVRNRLAVMLAGRAAEMIAFGTNGRSSGASHDLDSATQMAWRAVALAGLDDDFGPLSLSGFRKVADIPSCLAEKAWERVTAWLREAEAQAKEALHLHWEFVEQLADLLLEQEQIDGAAVEHLFRSCSTNNAVSSPSVPSRSLFVIMETEEET